MAQAALQYAHVLNSQHPGAAGPAGPAGPAPRVHTKLLDALLEQGLIAAEDHEAAALFAKRRQLHVEEAIIQMGLLSEVDLLRFQAAHYKTHFVSTKKLASAKIHDSLLKLVTHKLATKLCVFPVKYDAKQQELSILAVEPDDLDVLKNVQFATRVPKVRALVARPAAIQAAIRAHFEGKSAAFTQVRNTGSITGLSVERDRGKALDSSSSLSPPGHRDPTFEEVEEEEPPPLPPVARPGRLRRTTEVGGPPPPPPPAPPIVPIAGLTPASFDPGTLSGLRAPTFAGTHGPTLTGVHGPTLSGLQAPTLTGVPAPASGSGVHPAYGGAPMAGPPQSHEYMAPFEAAPRAAGVSMHDYLETLNVLIALLENDRGELRGHSVGVARVCRRVCERLDLQQEESDSILTAAYLHDVGKTSAYHLTALNVAEYEAHRMQARKSYLTPGRILESVRLPGEVTRILTHLYERYDGQGFPDRLQGKEIPLGARVLAIVETYADLTGHAGNPFRKKLTREDAWGVLSKFKGKIFDAGLVDVFKSVVLGDDLRAKLLADSRRALLVDADAEDTTVLELRLAEHGFQVTIARNASDAENELTQEFDVVISEVDLHPMDGFELFRRVRAKQIGVPFVFLSKQSDSDVVQRALDMGAEDFISKPASPEVVALKVNRVLDAARRAKRKAGVSGSLTEMALPDVVQILFHGRKSGKLTISSGGKKGEILFSEGQIFDASFGEIEREDAFYAMIGLSDGDFELDPNMRPGERLIEMSPESLLLEGMRRMDESGR